MPPSEGKITARSVESTPLLDKQLRERFKTSDERAAFVNQSLALSQSASARAWALRRLADRYTPRDLALLDRGSRQRLQELLSDHVSALQQDISRLRNQLGAVMSTSSNTAADNINVKERPGARESQAAAASSANPSPAGASSEDWRVNARRVHSSVETVDECVAVLLVGDAADGEDVEKLQLRLRTTLTELQTELEVLDHQVRTQI
jgi:hypothetical protein